MDIQYNPEDVERIACAIYSITGEDPKELVLPRTYRLRRTVRGALAVSNIPTEPAWHQHAEEAKAVIDELKERPL